MLKKTLCFFFTLLLSCQLTFASQLPDISADGAVLIDIKTNTILYAKNMNLNFYPASTTKILTSLAILQDMDVNQVITKTQTAVNNVPSDSSQIGLKIGDQYTVYDGLHAVLMASDNFVCYDLALADAGSIPNFANKMNDLALISGANHYNFVNPHGYHDKNHYTSPYSLARIGIAAFSNPTLQEIAGTYKYDFTVANTGRVIPLTHTAALLDPNSPNYNEHVVAAKTGFHDAAKRTLVAKAVYGDMELVGVIMRTDAPHQFEDMNQLFNYAAANFSLSVANEDSYVLSNHSYSAWAKPYIQEAAANGWITNTVLNYMSPITQRELVNLLRCISPAEYSSLLTDMIHYNGNSIYLENEKATKGQAAQIIYDYLSHFNLIPLNDAPAISDISQEAKDRQKAISFCVQTGIFTAKDGKFNPNDILSYEEAVCLTSKINNILTRYTSYHI